MEAHGGNIYEYEKKEILMDFSSNINPLGVPESFKRRMGEAVSDLVKYPDIHYTRLRKNLEAYTKVERSCLFPGNGAVDILYKGIKASGADRVLIAAPTFGEYRRGAEIAGLEYEELPLQSMEQATLDVEKTMTALKDRQKTGERLLLVICNPNNPNGGLTPVDKLVQLAQELKKGNGRLLIDEAFIEFTDEYPKSSFAERLKDEKNTMITRAMTKFYGMPGIRFGYGMTYDKEWMSAMEREGEPWAVNTFAELAADCVLKDQEYIDRTRSWVREERAFLLGALSHIQGMEVYPTYSDFLLCSLKGNRENFSGDVLYERMLEENILIRKSTGFTGLDGNCFRLAIKDRASNEKLISALMKRMRE